MKSRGIYLRRQTGNNLYIQRANVEAFTHASILDLASDLTNLDGKFEGKKGILPQQKFSVLKNIVLFQNLFRNYFNWKKKS